MVNIPTPHITAKEGDFAKTVLMPGDPKRSKFIADNFLENPILINDVRGVQGYTGYYKGKKISVMASGMGMPSIGIYSHELFNFYGVENIIRVGTAGAISKKLKVGDMVIAMGACTNSNFVDQFDLPGKFAPIASYELVEKAVNECRNKNYGYLVGNVFSSDTFYTPKNNEGWRDMGVLAVEMEAAALYINALKAGKNALCICTISDIPETGEGMTAEQRQIGLAKMIELALEIG